MEKLCKSKIPNGGDGNGGDVNGGDGGGDDD